MKILFINSSYRGRKGLTSFLIDRMAQGVRAAGAELEIVALAEKKINHCLACDVCQSASRLGICVHREQDEVHAIYQKIIQADLIVYATPIYVLGLSGLLKIFFDRMYAYAPATSLQLTRSGLFFHAVPPELCMKPFVALICCDNFEDRMTYNCTDYFKAFAAFHDAPRAGQIIRNSGRLLTRVKEAVPEARRQQIFAAFERAGYELGRTGKISPATQRSASREAIPLPLFRYLKNFRVIKESVLRTARQHLVAAEGDRPVTAPGRGHE